MTTNHAAAETAVRVLAVSDPYENNWYYAYEVAVALLGEEEGNALYERIHEETEGSND